MTEHLLTPREVAERLRVSPRTVQNWIRDGKLPATRVSPRIVRVPADAVEALVSGASVAAETSATYCVTPSASSRLRSRLSTNRSRILELAALYHLTNVRVFGSVARGDANDSSDVDLLVDLEPRASLLDLAGFSYDVEQLVGVPVDVAPASKVHEQYRAHALAEAMDL